MCQNFENIFQMKHFNTCYIHSNASLLKTKQNKKNETLCWTLS